MPASEKKDKKPLFQTSLLRQRAMILPAGFFLVLVARLLTNVSYRLIFPFLPRIADGLGVSLVTIGIALAIRDLTGLISPALGRSADRRGYVNAMVLGLCSLAIALVVQTASGNLILFTIGLIGVTIAKNLFDVGSAGWVGASVTYASRGRAMGYMETSWALAFIVAMPLAAVAIRASTWRLPFLITAVGCLVASVSLETKLDRPKVTTCKQPRLCWTTSIRAGLGAIIAVGVAHAMMLVTFASWLENEHAISVSGLGLTAIVIGIAELGGSGGAALISDRLGLIRSIELALVGSVVASLLIPLGSAAIVVALVVMGAYFIMIEFAVVALLSLFSELDREARGTAIGYFFGGFTLGHSGGVIAGTQLFERSGMEMNAVAMSGAFGIAFVIVKMFITEPEVEN